MKLAFISSTKFPELSDLGHIEMGLAHLVLKDEGYATRLRRKSDEGKFVILDNSAFEMQELGQGVMTEELILAAQLVRASEVICPDILYEGEATLEATRQFLKVATRELPIGTSYMGVAQGKTAEEFVECGTWLLRENSIKCVGLSKLSVPRCFQRDKEPLLITRRRASMALPNWKDQHLLGGDWSLPLELASWTAGGARVRSNDSSWAYWYAEAGLGISSDLLPMKDVGSLTAVSFGHV